MYELNCDANVAAALVCYADYGQMALCTMMTSLEMGRDALSRGNITGCCL